MTEKTAETALPDASKGWGQETFALRHPFTFAGVERREVKIRVPTGADIQRLWVEAEGRKGFRPLALALAEIDERALDAFHAEDYSRLLAFVGKFVLATP